MYVRTYQLTLLMLKSPSPNKQNWFIENNECGGYFDFRCLVRLANQRNDQPFIYTLTVYRTFYILLHMGKTTFNDSQILRTSFSINIIM